MVFSWITEEKKQSSSIHHPSNSFLPVERSSQGELWLQSFLTKQGGLRLQRLCCKVTGMSLLFIFFKCTLVGFQGQSVQAITMVDGENTTHIKLTLYINNV